MLPVSGPTINVANLELVTLAALKPFIGIPHANDDVRLQAVLDQVHRSIYSYTGRVLKYSATPWVAIQTQGTYGMRLWLPQWPIGTVTSVQYGRIASSALDLTVSHTLTSAEYFADTDSGSLELVGGFRWPGEHIRVEWTAGFSTVPPDLVKVVMEWAGIVYDRAVTKRWDVSTEARESKSQTWRETEIPLYARAVLDQYRRESGIAA